MLCSLNIQGLTVVDSLDLELTNGFTVLTGETGAGKSILLTAMGLALGERADSGYLRPGFDRAEITLEFDLKDSPSAQALLEELGLEESGDCIIRRTITRDGRSRAFVNSRPVTLQVLAGLGRELIDIHGQHAHLSLLSSDQQRKLIDESGNHQPLLQQLARIASHWNLVQGRITETRDSLSGAHDRREFLQFQIGEMEAAEIESLNYSALIEEHATQANADHILSAGNAQLDALYDGDQHSINSRLNSAIRSISEIAGVASELEPVVEMLGEAQIQIQESSLLLRRTLDSIETNPRQLELLEDRLAVIHALARKHRTEAENLPPKLMELRTEINEVGDASRRLEELELESSKLVAEYANLAGRLSENRIRVAERLQEAVSHAIQELGMPQGEFRIEISRPGDTDIPRSSGFDHVEFRVSANPGLPPRPLAKVASGGELSRISLAIQVAATASCDTPTMVFDEVDSGIGGGIAEIVGNRLRQLGNRHQVLCITHLPQVAAQAHHHLLVEKQSGNADTRSTVRSLEKEQRIQEIARMLGGIEITTQTLAHAGEMLEWSEKTD